MNDSVAHMTPPTRSRKLKRPAAVWQRWMRVSLALGAVMGAAWFVLAPGGAIYGDGKDYATWFPRDLALAALMLVAGVLSAVLLLRQGRKTPLIWGSAASTLALLVGGLAGSVLAWRIGVFAGDLFQTVPDNLPSPSMIFSLRSPAVLLLWPLASAAVLFVVHFAHYLAPPAGQNSPAGVPEQAVAQQAPMTETAAQ